LKRDEQVEEHASSHVGEVRIEEDQATTDDTPSKLTYEADDTSVLHGYDTDDEGMTTPNYDMDSVPICEDASMTVPE